MPTSLREMNIPDDRLEEMAEKATLGGSLEQFKKLDKDIVLEILRLAR